MAATYMFWLLCGTGIGLSILGGVSSSFECYSQFCSEKGCLTKNAASKCTGDAQFGCKVTLSVNRRSVRYDADCVRGGACTNEASPSDTKYIRTACCNSSLCNIELPEITKGSNQCYKYKCNGKDCNKYVIGNMTASSCPKTADGCFMRKIKEPLTYEAGCVSQGNTCSEPKWGATAIHCCKEDLCNDGEFGWPSPPDKTSAASPTGHGLLPMTALIGAMATWAVAI